MRTFLHVALLLVLVSVFGGLIWAIHHDLGEPNDVVVELAPCPVGTYLRGDGQCKVPFELTEFVPDLPERMYTAYELVISNATAVVEAFQPAIGPLRINSGPWVNCLHWDGNRIAFVVLANGRRVRVPCEQ